ncbi:fimbria/pilus outer membrane usher protein [Alkalisalibacterium limincola]|uniref:fimbria/pilus outer membrane usher protein n=1 Tax=Alkalisalibacterium limincola TaxID=2699169 RepID=UPI0021049B96|nr:fimbria/pilus outer membrane usher protein [Alkalisalibacterium limincola]
MAALRPDLPHRGRPGFRRGGTRTRGQLRHRLLVAGGPLVASRQHGDAAPGAASRAQRRNRPGIAVAGPGPPAGEHRASPRARRPRHRGLPERDRRPRHPARVGLGSAQCLGRPGLERQRRFGRPAHGRARSRPPATGWGYDVDLGHGEEGTRGFGQLEYQGRHARYALQAQRVGGFERVRAQASGSVVGIGGRVFVAPPLDAGFALVRLPGVEGVPVEREGLEVVRTDARGDALVRGLLPWYPVRVGFDATRLPIGYRYDTALKRVVVAPGTGAIATFDVTALQSLRGRVLLGHGREPAGLGTLVVLDDSGAELARSSLGSHGDFWFDHLAPGAYDGVVLHDGREYRCRLALQGPARAGIAHAGEVHCPGDSDGN